MTIHTPDWVKDAVFYQIFPDRFAKSSRINRDGLKLEEWESNPTPHGFKGGDLYGVLEKLDYIQELGITAIYFNPIFHQHPTTATTHMIITMSILSWAESLPLKSCLTNAKREVSGWCWTGCSIMPAGDFGSFIMCWKMAQVLLMWIGSILTTTGLMERDLGEHTLAPKKSKTWEKELEAFKPSVTRLGGTCQPCRN